MFEIVAGSFIILAICRPGFIPLAVVIIIILRDIPELVE